MVRDTELTKCLGWFWGFGDCMEISFFIAVVVYELVHCFLDYFINQRTVEIVNNIPSLRLLSSAMQFNSKSYTTL